MTLYMVTDHLIPTKRPHTSKLTKELLTVKGHKYPIVVIRTNRIRTHAFQLMTFEQFVASEILTTILTP